jgi:hypothetical protein
MKLPYDHGARNDRGVGEVNAGLAARRRTSNHNLPGCGVHVDPTTLFMTVGRIIRLRITPSLL